MPDAKKSFCNRNSWVLQIPEMERPEVLDVDVYPYIAWKNKDMVFVNERLESIMEKIERWYDVNVFFQNERLKDLRFLRGHETLLRYPGNISLFGEEFGCSFQVNGRTLIGVKNKTGICEIPAVFNNG